MNSDQERAIFEQYGWAYNYVARAWVAPDDTRLTQDQLMDITASTLGDLSLMKFIVEHGQRKP